MSMSLALGSTNMQPVPLQAAQPDKLNPEPTNQGIPAQQATQPYYYAWRNTLSTIPADRYLNYAQQYGGDVLPVLAPRLASATPIISGAFAGYNAYSAVRSEYDSTKDLPPRTRYQKLAAKIGDLTLFHLLANLVIPGLMAKKVNQWIEKALTSPKVPAVITRHPKWVTILALTMLTAVISKPVNKLVNFVLDWTYRPLVEKRKREKWQKLYNEAYHARVQARRLALQKAKPLPPPVEEPKGIEVTA
jgi:hypothetical protein